jgi:hypothetical protein
MDPIRTGEFEHP